MKSYRVREVFDSHGHLTHKFQFSCRSKNNIKPVGYCVHNHKHKTIQEAADCYKQYLINNNLRFKQHVKNQSGFYQHCVECGWITNGYGEILEKRIPLCNEHQTKELVFKHFKMPEKIIEYENDSIEEAVLV